MSNNNGNNGNNNMWTTATQQEELAKRWNLLSDFVQKTCAGRDESHGHAHMQAVATTARYLVQTDFANRRQYYHLILDTTTVAWLHDIADHKYDHDGTLQQTLDDFGYEHISNYQDIKKVIKYVSYSSENKAILAGTPLDYDTILMPYYALVRHIVSDADKLEAIGQIGITRALEYTRDANPAYTEQQVIADVCKHANEKLLRLASDFIRTPTARALAQQRHQEMEQWVRGNEENN
jgi:HD superfamily phosphodiesterase